MQIKRRHSDRQFHYIFHYIFLFKIQHKICNGELHSEKPVQKHTENPVKYAKTQKIRPSEEGRIFQMVGVSGFEPVETARKTLVPQRFSHFITLFHYILCCFKDRIIPSPADCIIVEISLPAEVRISIAGWDI